MFVLVAWAVLHGMLYWLVLLALSAFQGVEAATPALFTACFIGSAVLLCVLVFIARFIAPHERLSDRKTGWMIVIDFLLVVPRATVSVWGTLSAFQFLKTRELEQAFRLLQFIARNRRVEIQSLAQVIPDIRLQQRLLLALQLAGLVDLRQTSEGPRLVVKDSEAQRFAESTVRLDIKSHGRYRSRR